MLTNLVFLGYLYENLSSHEPNLSTLHLVEKEAAVRERKTNQASKAEPPAKP